MPHDIHIKPTHKAITAFYARRHEIAAQGATNEMGVRDAFNDLLQGLAREARWTMVPEQWVAGAGRSIRPDGTLYDAFRIPRGYWESKDSADDLEAEIVHKFARGYPQSNIIFENSARAVLYQNRRRQGVYDLNKPADIAQLFTLFLNHEDPAIEGFEQAVDHFKEQTPELARGLLALIRQAHKSNTRFQAAFAAFHALCRGALDPKLSADAVDDMLVQHLLTERLMRTVFSHTEFRGKNAIAQEVEKVIAALTAGHFSREDYLGQLNGFYSAIESAAASITDFHDKQGFITTVYERFFQGYSVKVADTHGIVYTPQPIVAFMVAAVDDALRREFGYGLDAPDVVTIDPCTGTGSFIVHILQRLAQTNPGALKAAYRERLFANEVLLMPYYVASLNIEHAFLELNGDQYEPFEGLVLADTLGLAEHAGGQLGMFSEENAERVEREKDAPITVILGNPPYNMGQDNENDNNQNRAYNVLDERLHQTYVRDSAATLRNKLYDPYVRFFRWATDRLGDRDGIVCFISNNGFIDGIAFDGMRKHLLQDFDCIYHLDMAGNARTSGERRRKEGGNVFSDQIRVGIGITLAIRNKSRADKCLYYHRTSDYGKAEDKLQLLLDHTAAPLDSIPWAELTPDERHTWLVPENADEYAGYLPMGSKDAKQGRTGAEETIFDLYSLGVTTNRDEWAYAFSQDDLVEKMKRFIQNYNSEVFRFSQRENLQIHADSFVNNDPSFIKWTDRLKSSLLTGHYIKFDVAQVRASVYRPFMRQFVYFDHLLNQRRYQQHRIFPIPSSEQENLAICISGIGGSKSFHVLATNVIPDLHLTGDSQCFPFYTYDEDGGNRRENITDAALQRFRAHYGDDTISKWDIFHYVYALLHHPGYRERYAGNLKRELPRIPFAPDFAAFAQAGQQLAALHVGYESVTPYPLQERWLPGAPASWRVEKMKLSADNTEIAVNRVLTLTGLPPETFAYRLGSRSALEWVIDQYRVKTDPRSGISSDPNQYSSDERYIVDLVRRVVQVSVETVALVQTLAALGFIPHP
jgi:predicted helicase